MKKVFIYTMLALGAGLSSCTTKDLNWESPDKGPVQVEVKLPEEGEPTDGATAPFPETPEGYQLRCVLQVGGERYEAVESEAVNNKFYFEEANVPEGSTLYVWADYIPADAVKGADGRYPDLYYNTQSLPAVTFADGVMTDGSLFNNAACDAFYGHSTAGMPVQLKRPFARVTFSNEDAITLAGDIEVSYEVFNRFDIVSGAASGRGTISYTGEVADRANRVWFSNFLFANPVEGKVALSDISIEGDGVLKLFDTSRLLLAAGDGPVDAHFNWADANASIKVDVGFDDPDAPRVGDYYYSDGTWSPMLKSNKTAVGVIFALADEGEAASDVVGNYEGVTFTGNAIHGWVVGLQEYASSPRFVQISTATGTAGSTIEGIEGVATHNLSDGTTCTDIMGYANTKAWKANKLSEGKTYPALEALDTYPLSAPEAGTSGWYIPSLKQLLVLRDAYNAKGSKVKSALKAMPEQEEVTYVLNEGTGNDAYYWSSTARGRDDGNQVWLLRFSSTVDSYTVSTTGNSGRHVRPILTF